ncbi:hypothetical protein M0811_06881 [Anaeramoeba ignava]|uniref:Uncharacterized protein n=1 Tax=Anaeramoeba ignava TaxID=1746090 RepID=A0A9Q0RES6_ANAIG|nr:hypothetical protein M0811_06881 [Anaeramoeba ignava]
MSIFSEETLKILSQVKIIYEDLNHSDETPPVQILIDWVNSKLKNLSPSKEIHNLKFDFKDSSILKLFLVALFPYQDFPELNKTSNNVTRAKKIIDQLSPNSL